MKKALLTGLVLLPVVAFAKLGDTRAQTEKNWHAPTSVDAQMNACTYVKGKYTLVETYNENGKAMSSVYMVNTEKLDPDDFAKMMEDNIKGLRHDNKSKYHKSDVKIVSTKDARTDFYKDDYIVQQTRTDGIYIIGFYTNESPTFADIKQDIEDQQFTP